MKWLKIPLEELPPGYATLAGTWFGIPTPTGKLPTVEAICAHTNLSPGDAIAGPSPGRPDDPTGR